MASADSIPLAPGSRPVVGHLPRLLRDPLRFLRSLPPHGDLVRVRIGPYQAVVVCDAALTRQVLVDDRTFDKGGFFYDRFREAIGNGLGTCPHQLHRRQRRLTQPAFRRGCLEAYAPIMTDQVAAVTATWEAGQTIDVWAEMQKVTTRVLLATMFGTALSPPAIAQATADSSALLGGIYRRMLVPISHLADRRYQQAVARLRDTLRTLIGEGDAAHGFVSILLSVPTPDGRGFSEDELIDQVVGFFIGGVESAASTLALSFHLLAEHPEIEQRLHDEVDTVLSGRPARFADLSRLRLACDIITEALRLFPPGWLITRTATTDTHLGGHAIPAGTTIIYSPYVIHHRPDLYHDPEVFDPDRWAENVPPPLRDAFIPFATGARKCIADEFAMVEAVIALTYVAARWRLRPTPGVPRQPQPRAVLRPRKLQMRLSARPNAGEAPLPQDD